MALCRATQWSSAVLVVACIALALPRDASAQANLDCRAPSDLESRWHGCWDGPIQSTGLYCVGCGAGTSGAAPAPREYAADLTDQEVLLFLAYGLSDELRMEIDASLWQRQSFTRARRFLDGPAPEDLFALRWRGSRINETRNRPDLMGYLTTVLPAARLPKSTQCRDCEFTLAMGMVWGYRWSTLSARVSSDAGFRDLAETPDYGFRFLHRASPKWRYVLEVGRDAETADLIGEARWRLRPDAYLSLKAGFWELGTFDDPISDLKLHFSFD